MHTIAHTGRGWIHTDIYGRGRYSIVFEKINKKQIPIYKNNII